MNRSTLRRVAVRLNGGAVRGSSKALAEAMGVPVRTARAWMLKPGEENYRTMSRTAKRLLAILVLLESTDRLTKEFLDALKGIEHLLEEENAVSQ